MKPKMEKAIDSFIEESASQYTAQELYEMFSTGEKAVDLLRAYIERKAKEAQNTVH
jgi:phage tail tape-measure protein